MLVPPPKACSGLARCYNTDRAREAIRSYSSPESKIRRCFLCREIAHWQVCKEAAAPIVAANAVITGRALGSSEGESAPGCELGIPHLYACKAKTAKWSCGYHSIVGLQALWSGDVGKRLHQRRGPGEFSESLSRTPRRGSYYWIFNGACSGR